MTKSKLLDYCILCGKQLPDNHATTRLMHDMMDHPWYLLAQADKIEESIDEIRKHNGEISRKKKLGEQSND